MHEDTVSSRGPVRVFLDAEQSPFSRCGALGIGSIDVRKVVALAPRNRALEGPLFCQPQIQQELAEKAKQAANDVSTIQPPLRSGPAHVASRKASRSSPRLKTVGTKDLLGLASMRDGIVSYAASSTAACFMIVQRS